MISCSDILCLDQLDLYMQGQEKAILDDNETEDHDPTTNVIGSTLCFLVVEIQIHIIVLLLW